MAKGLDPEQPLSEAELDAIAARSDGLPLAIEQFLLARDLLSTGARNNMPHGVQSLVHARLNTLSPPVKAIAQALAVIGEDVEFAIATDALDITAEDLLRGIEQLSGLAITHPFIGQSIRFRHAIVADACANTVPIGRHRQLHERMVGALLSGDHDSTPDNARLAFHAQGADDHSNALEFLWLALLQARENFASASIVRILGQAFESIAQLDDQADDRFVDFVLTSFESVLQMGELRMLVDHMPRVLEVAHSRNRPDKICLATCQLAVSRWFEGNPQAGMDLARQAQASAAAIKAVPLISYASFALALNLHAAGKIRPAISVMSELRDALSGDLERRRLGSAGVFGAMVRSFIGYFQADTGDFEDGLQHAERGLLVSREEQEPYTQLLSRLALGKLHVNAEQFDEAIPHLEEGLALVTRHGYSAPRPHLTGLLASALANSGNTARALEVSTARWTDEDLAKSGALEACVLQIGRADAAWAAQKHDLAKSATAAARKIAEDIGNPALLLRCLERERRQIDGAGQDRANQIDQEMASLREAHGLASPLHGAT